MTRRALAVAAAITLAVVGTACAGSKDLAQPTRTVPNTGTLSTASSSSTSSTEAPGPAKDCVAAKALPPAEGKPTVSIPEGPPPTELQKTDLKVGTGAEAKAGDTVKVQYVGVSCSTGEQFDASWDRGQAFDFQLGAGKVIKGWDQGVAGMKVGGQRMLVIPASLGYGASGSPPKIAPNETLVFVVDLEEVNGAK